MKLRMLGIGVLALFLVAPAAASAASLSISPSSGSYTVGDSVVVKVLLNSTSQSANAVSGVLSIPTSIFTVSSVSKTNSILNFWTTDPVASQSAGTVTFEGVSLSGFQSTGGVIVTVVLKATHPGTGTVSFQSGQVLANDGQGTDITSGLNSASFIVSAKQAAPVTTPATTSPPVATPPSLQAPLVTNVTRTVALGGTAQITGTSIYPGATVQLTLQGSSGPLLTTQALVEQNGSYTLTRVHDMTPGDYIGSVIVIVGQDQSSPSASFVITFQGEPLYARIIDFLSATSTLFVLAILLAFVIGFFCGYRYHEMRRPIPIRETLRDVDVEIHKAFLTLRTRINQSIDDMEEESKTRALTTTEKRFIRSMTGVIKDTEKEIAQDVHKAGA